MARKPAPLVPRKVSISGHVRWEVRVPAELQPQERAARPRFLKESEANGYCNRLKSDLLCYSDKARGLTDAQKIEAHACVERLAGYPAATLTQAVDLLVARLDHAARSFPVRELAGRVVADKVDEGGRGSSQRLLRSPRPFYRGKTTLPRKRSRRVVFFLPAYSAWAKLVWRSMPPSLPNSTSRVAD